MTRIAYFFSPLSPFTYLAGARLEEIAEKHGATVDYLPFNIMQVFKATGTPALADRHPSRKAYRLQELKRIAAAKDMPINVQPMHFPTNPVPACTAIISAQMAGGGDVGALARCLMRAVWVDEQDIAEDHVVRRCLKEAGFDEGLADRDMLSAVEIYEKNTQDALDAGVFGSPTYIVDGHVFWGQDRLDYLDRHLGLMG